MEKTYEICFKSGRTIQISQKYFNDIVSNILESYKEGKDHHYSYWSDDNEDVTTFINIKEIQYISTL